MRSLDFAEIAPLVVSTLMLSEDTHIHKAYSIVPVYMYVWNICPILYILHMTEVYVYLSYEGIEQPARVMLPDIASNTTRRSKALPMCGPEQFV